MFGLVIIYLARILLIIGGDQEYILLLMIDGLLLQTNEAKL